MFTIHLALIFRAYGMYQWDFIINAGACILFLAEVLFDRILKNITKIILKCGV